ncbi:hypothetical protein [Streptomyces sp. NBC_01089]|nr:hypothetical protein OG510_17520 [Streptomyces sp. NBC_01089]
MNGTAARMRPAKSGMDIRRRPLTAVVPTPAAPRRQRNGGAP